MCPYIDLDAVNDPWTQTRGLDDIPGSLTVLTRRMADGDDHESGFISVITLNHGERSLCKQTLAGLILSSAQSMSS